MDGVVQVKRTTRWPIRSWIESLKIVCSKICRENRFNGGPIRDGGMLARFTKNDDTINFMGLSQQRIDRCYYEFDDLLFGKCPIVSCIRIAHDSNVEESNVFAQVLKVFGVNDVKKIRTSATLADLGADSLTVLEVKQILEREVNVTLCANRIRNLTVEELKNIIG